MLKPGMVSSSAESLFQQALAMHSAGQFGKAEALYRRSIEADFDQPGAKHNLGSLLQGLGRLKEAGEVFLNILKRHPDQQETLYALGVLLLDTGDYRRGWPYYEARRNLPALNVRAPDLPFPEWMGEPLAGKSIVLFPEQGQGDNIQFARFAPVLRDMGAHVTLLTRPALTELFAQSFDGIDVRSADGKVDLGEPDYWLLIGSLPLRLQLRHNASSIPGAPYLRAAAPPPPRPPGPLRIGLTTKGNPAQANDARRSLSPAQAARLQNLRNVQIVSLHPEDTRAEDFAATAQIIAGLDLVISVDTAVAHLAGAMGKQAFVLAPGFNNDWRWLRGQNGETTMWYPTHRLFRGDPSGAWNEALDRLTAAVAEQVAGGAPAVAGR
jgi:tetratricopeptide (TPR) repeat protein